MSWIFGMSHQKIANPTFEQPPQPSSVEPTTAPMLQQQPSPQKEGLMHPNDLPQVVQTGISANVNNETDSYPGIKRILMYLSKEIDKTNVELLKMQKFALENEYKIIELEAKMKKTPFHHMVEETKKNYAVFRTKSDEFIKKHPEKFAISCALTAAAAGMFFGIRGGRVLYRYVSASQKVFRPPPSQIFKHRIHDTKIALKVIISEPTILLPFVFSLAIPCLFIYLPISISIENRDLNEVTEKKRQITAAKIAKLENRIAELKEVFGEGQQTDDQ